MPFDGSGNFTRLFSWVSDRDNGIKILATRMDGEFDNFAAGMNVVFFRNGLVPMSGNLNLGQNYINNVGAGSVGALAIKFGDDPNSGIYLDGMGKPAIVANGTKRLEVNTTGVAVTGAFNVSGASTLGSTLAVTGAITRAGNTVWDAGNDGAGSGLDADLLDGQQGAYYADIPSRLGYIPVNRNGDTMTAKLQINASGEVFELNTSAARGTGANYITFSDPSGDKAFLGFAQFVNDQFLVYNAMNSPTIFSTNTVERMRIEAAGQVGIGRTPETDFLLDVNGRVRAQASSTGGFNIHYGGNVSSRSWNIRNDVNSFGDFVIQQSTTQTGLAYTDRVTIGPTGNFGIGISAPEAPLHIGGSAVSTRQAIFTNGVSDPNFRVLAANGVSGGSSYTKMGSIGLHYAANGPAAVVNFLRGDTVTDGTITFETDAVERMRIDRAGSVGIGGSPVGYGARLSVVPLTTPSTIAGANQIVVGESGSNANFRNQLGYYNDPVQGFLGSLQAYGGGVPSALTINGAGGNVMIGGTTPLGKLTIASASGANRIAITGPSAASYIGYDGVTDGLQLAANADIIFQAGGYSERARISAAGVFTYGGIEVGYKDIPRVTGGIERGKVFAAAAAVTFNTGEAAGSTFSVYNDSAGAINLIQGAGLTLRLAGTTTTGTRTIAARAFATVWYNSTTEAIVSGAGVI